MESARYGRERRLKLLVQAYAFIGLAAIVILMLSSAEGPTLLDYSSIEAEGQSEAGLFSRFMSMLSITGAAVGESAEDEPPEVQDTVPEAVAGPQPEAPEQFTLAFEPAGAASLTTLATSGEMRAGTVTLINNGDEASNVKLSVRSPDGLFTSIEIGLGTLESGESRSEELSLDFSEEAAGHGLAGDASLSILLKFALGFADADNFLHQQSYSSTLPVLGRRVVEDAPRGYARFVPQSDPVIERFVAEHLGGVRAKDTLESQRLSARWIFESLQTLDIGMLPDSQHEVRFPAESLSERTATPTDLAVLYAALLNSAGFDAALISSGERLLPAYVDPRGYIVPLAPDAPDYEEALTRAVALLQEGPYSTTVLEDVWTEFPSAKFPSEKLSIGEWPTMTRQVGRCALEPLAVGVSKAKVPVRLSNTGAAVGIGCVGLVGYESDQRSGTIFECYTVNPGGVLDTELSTLVIGNSPSCEEI